MSTDVKDIPFLDGLQPSFTLDLRMPLTSPDGKETYNRVVINEPNFTQVEAFYREQVKNGNMAAMGLLISLTSDPQILPDVIRVMNYRDYRKAERYLLDFLRYPSSSGEMP